GGSAGARALRKAAVKYAAGKFADGRLVITLAGKFNGRDVTVAGWWRVAGLQCSCAGERNLNRRSRGRVDNLWRLRQRSSRHQSGNCGERDMDAWCHGFRLRKRQHAASACTHRSGLGDFKKNCVMKVARVYSATLTVSTSWLRAAKPRYSSAGVYRSSNFSAVIAYSSEPSLLFDTM